MNKLSFCIIFMSIIMSLSAYSQTDELQQPIQFPGYALPSPQTYTVTRYGNQEINESTGKVNLSIPIYNYKAGNLFVPITMNYLGNGVKVNDIPTWVGMNWTIRAGGFITRTIFHKPDELVTERIFESELDLDALNTENQNAEHIYSFINSTGNSWDTEPDIFSFTFGNYSGSFYLSHDEMDTQDAESNYRPVLINSDLNLKIDIVDSTGNITNNHQSTLIHHKRFKITTPDGVCYFFGGKTINNIDAFEETKLERSPHHTFITPRGVTSFYLSEIKHPIHGTVYFEYIDVGDYEVDLSQSMQVYKYQSDFNLGYPENNCIQPPNCEPIEEVFLQNYNPDIITNNIFGGKFLTRIYSPNNSDEIIFKSSNSINGGSNFERVLKSIEIKNNESLINETVFSYDYHYNDGIAQRFFLKKIEFDKEFDTNFNEATDPTNRKHKTYEFEYNDPMSLPPRFSFSQDALGYYNGESNTTLFPQIGLMDDNPGHVFLGTLPYSTAKRNTDFEFKSKGVLKRVYYPTGGHTLYNYESPIYKADGRKLISMETFINNFPLNNNTYHEDEIYKSVIIGDQSETSINLIASPFVDANLGIDLEDDNFFDNSCVLSVSQDVIINVFIQSTTQAYHSDVTYLKIANLTDEVDTIHEIVMPVNPTEYDSDFTYNRAFLVSLNRNKVYRISLYFDESNNQSMKARASFSLKAKGLIQGEGLRVKRISDYEKTSSEDNLQTPYNIKRYYYTKSERVFLPLMSLVEEYIEPKFSNSATLLKNCAGWLVNNCSFVRADLSAIISGHYGYIFSIYPHNYNENIINNFEYVTISYGGDSFQEGGEEKQFNIESGNVVLETKTPRIQTVEHSSKLNTHSGAEWMFPHRGKLYKERKLIKKDSALYKVKELQFHYLNRQLASQEVFVTSIFKDTGPGRIYPSENVGVGKYEILSKDTSLDRIKEIDYIDPYPLAWTNIPIRNNYTTNPFIYRGWQFNDYDNDGEMNYLDQDYLNLISSYENDDYNNEAAHYRKIIKTTDYEYNSEFPGQPTKIRTSNSVSNEIMEIRNYYLDEISSLNNITSDQLAFADDLIKNNRVSAPIQTESYLNKDSVLTKLSTKRTLYSDFLGKVLDTIIQSSKGYNPLENKVVFLEYDVKGNPTLARYEDGPMVKYVYNDLDQVVKKIENYTSEDFGVDISGTDCENNSLIYEDAQVTLYYYDDVTHQVVKITDPRCQSFFYEYDDFHRLKHVKDNDGNILTKNEYNYKN